jgi:branched-subunit amino acid transport protein
MIAQLGTAQSWLLVISLAIGTFLIRYSFIGLFANRDMPPWLQHALKLMVPAIFAAIVFSGVMMVSGQVAGMAYWPRYAAALIAFIAAIATRGNMLVTVGVGMAALHGLPWLATKF